MPRYQCYLLTHDLHIAQEKNFEAADDVEAFRKSRIVVDRQGPSRAFELWHGDRRIGNELDETAQACAPRN